MRYLVLSDVHGDLRALEAVLADAGPVDGTFFLGDAVDFGPEPEECVQRLRAVSTVWVQGNHDAAVARREPGDGWSPARLSAASRAFLADLPEQVVVAGATLRHYFRSDILPPEPADLDAFETDLCLVGHTHVPYAYLRGPEGESRLLEPTPGRPLELSRRRVIANPGSVGLSFVAQNVASYLVYEIGDGPPTLTWRAVPRSAAGVVERMRTNGAPDDLIAGSRSYVEGGLSFQVDTEAAHRAWAASG